MLALYIYDLSQSLIDLDVEIHDKQINILLSKGRKEQEEIQNLKSILCMQVSVGVNQN